MSVTSESLFSWSLLALFIPLIVAGIAYLDPCPDDELLDKSRPYLTVIGVLGIIGMIWSGWLAIRPMFG